MANILMHGDGAGLLWFLTVVLLIKVGCCKIKISNGSGEYRLP
ncbi:hypothetical protein EJ110_NYTH36121 [Nymphaea thermarum]|nr:hypothetical protein EJ110_NYTH36121 [Nymphaea thermarum]